MEIVRAGEKEEAAVYALLCQLEGRALDQAAFHEVYLENLENPRVVYLLSLERGTISGFCSLHVQPLLHHAGRIAEIQELIVCPSQRGSGAGRALFSAAMQKAREMNCIQLEVCCNLNRALSHHFYAHMGLMKSHYKFTTLPFFPSDD